VSDHEPADFHGDEPDRSFCQLDFELTKGRVTRVSAQGRTRGHERHGNSLLRAGRASPMPTTRPRADLE
jgi:hypothetical protein